MEGESGFRETTNSGSGISPTTAPTDDPCLLIPAHFTGWTLGFRLITTIITFLMAGWVFITITTTRRIRKSHNIFVANLMVADMMLALLTTPQSCIMMIGYLTGIGDFITCNVFTFLLFPIVETSFMYFMISVDKVIAIVFPYKYRQIMTTRAVKCMIATTWSLSLALYVRRLFILDSHTKVSQFGAYIPAKSSFFESLFTFILPAVSASVLTVVTDIYLVVKAYQMKKKIEAESRLSGTTNELKALKNKQAVIRKNLKPMMTLLIVALGSTFTGTLFPIAYGISQTLDSPAQKCFMHGVITTNIGYIMILLHPFVYGMYFKQVRGPMMKTMKSMICKFKQQ